MQSGSRDERCLRGGCTDGLRASLTGPRDAAKGGFEGLVFAFDLSCGWSPAVNFVVVYSVS
jgi:hypothetical protein